MSDIRPPAVAGSWYPSRPALLRDEVDRYLQAATVAPLSSAPRALVAPHAGLIYSGPIAAFSYQTIAARRYAAVVLVGPSHFVRFEGVSVWPRGGWQTPFGELPVSTELATRLQRRCAEIVELPDAHGREHSLELQLPFVARLLPGVPIVPLVMGEQTRTTAFGLGEALAAAIADFEAESEPRSSSRDGGVLLIASSDLSHYYDAAAAATLDRVVLDHVARGDAVGLMASLEGEPDHACGGGPVVAVLHAARQLGAARARVLAYGDSGDISGDKSAVVGYMAAALW